MSMLSEDFRFRGVLKARKKPKNPVDGDSDGLVYDNTPRERPAVPNVDLDKPRGPRRPKGVKGPEGRKKPKTPEGPDKPDGPKPIKKPKQLAGRFHKPSGEKGSRELGGAWKIEHNGQERVGARVVVSDGREEHVMNVVASDYEDMRNEILLISQEGWEIRDVMRPKPSGVRPSQQLKSEDIPDVPTGQDRRLPDGPNMEKPPKPDAPEAPKAPDKPAEPKKPVVPDKPTEGSFFAKRDSDESGKRMVGRSTTDKNSSSGGSRIFEDTQDDTGVATPLPGGKKTTNRVHYVKRAADDHAATSEVQSSAVYRAMGYDLPEASAEWFGKRHAPIAQADIGQHRGAQMKPMSKVGKLKSVVFDMMKEEHKRRGKGQPLTLEDWAEKFDTDERAGEVLDLLADGKDPGGVLRLAIHDFFMLQQDRHDDNILIDADGVVAPVDNDWGWAGGLIARTGSADTEVPGSWEDWMNFRAVYGGDRNWAVMQHALGAAALDYDYDKIRAEIDRAIAEAEKVDAEQIVATLKAQGMDEEMLGKVREDLAQFQARVQSMKKDADAIARMLSE